VVLKGSPSRRSIGGGSGYLGRRGPGDFDYCDIKKSEDGNWKNVCSGGKQRKAKLTRGKRGGSRKKILSVKIGPEF